MADVDDVGRGDERRSRHNLRLIFEAACKISAPFFDVSQGFSGQPSALYARQTLRDAYPELSQQEIALLFSAVRRFHTASNNN